MSEMKANDPAFPAVAPNGDCYSGISQRLLGTFIIAAGIRANSKTMQEVMDLAGYSPGECVEEIVRMMAEAQADALIEAAEARDE